MRNITAEQVELAKAAADELEQMGNQICDPPHIKKQFLDWASAVRFVVENFSTAELALQQEREINEVLGMNLDALKWKA